MPKKPFARLIVQFLILSLLGSCVSVQHTTSHEMADGSYQFRAGGENQNVFLKFEDDLIQIHSREGIIEMPHYTINDSSLAVKLVKPTFDIDILTTLVKFRPATENVPAQLNANINGSIYLGYRRDNYKISYQANELGSWHRKTRHLGYSGGVFIGAGNTFMSPTNTNHALEMEYDGVVMQKGISAIVAVDNISLGLSLGFDNLLDKNRKHWIYQNKPWIGLMIGFNLN